MLRRTGLALLLTTAVVLSSTSVSAQTRSGDDPALRISLDAVFALVGAPVGGVVLGALGWSLAAGAGRDGIDSFYLAGALGIVGATFSVPLAVTIVSDLTGAGSHYGWALLGTLVGAMPGVIALCVSYALDEESPRVDPSAGYVTGTVLASVGAIAGAILAYELSRDGAPIDASLTPAFYDGGAGATLGIRF